jgi:hypothetical protein
MSLFEARSSQFRSQGIEPQFRRFNLSGQFRLSARQWASDGVAGLG